MSKYADVDQIAEWMLKKGKRLSGVLRAVVAIENARAPNQFDRTTIVPKADPEAETVKP